MATSLPFRERRAHQRLSATIEVRYGAAGEFQRAQACDISPAGIGLAGPTLYPVGTYVDLRFQAHDQPRGDLVLLKTRVRHSATGRMGLEFVNVPAGEQARIVGLLQELAVEQRA